jgi:hypothetical protein
MANKLLQINKSETQNYQLLGKAIGVSIEHCLYLANKYKKNFPQRVVAYRFSEIDQKLADLEKLTGKKYLAMEFFEEKPGENQQ